MKRRNKGASKQKGRYISKVAKHMTLFNEREGQVTRLSGLLPLKKCYRAKQPHENWLEGTTRVSPPHKVAVRYS